MEEVKIWALEGSKVVELERAERTGTEKSLEDTLVSNPGLLEENLTLVGRQTRTQGGPLDLLGWTRTAGLSCLSSSAALFPGMRWLR